MPDPSSFMIGNAPAGANYAAPLVGWLAGDRIAKLPEQYHEAQLRNAFPNGLPMRNGQPDVNAISSKLLEIGGAPYAQQMLPALIGQQSDAAVQAALGGNLGGGLQGGSQQGVPQQPAAPGPQSAVQPTPASSSASPRVSSTDTQPLPASSSAAGPANITGDFNQPEKGKTYAQAPGGASGSPAPTGVQQVSRGTTRIDPTLAALVPASFLAKGGTPEQYRDILQQIGAKYGITPNAKSVVDQKVKAIDDYLQKRGIATVESGLRNTEKTQEMKNAESAGFQNPRDYEMQKQIDKSDLEDANNMYKGISGMSMSSANMLNNSRLQLQLVNNPDFFSGTGANFELAIKRLFPSLGSPTADELYNKVLNKNMLQTISNMKSEETEMGEKAGRLFKPQIDQVEKANGTLDNSVTGLRALAILQHKTLEWNMQIGKLATDYKNGNYRKLPPEFQSQGAPRRVGVLDDNFRQGLQEWIVNHPVLTQQEEQDPRILGARMFSSPAAAKAANLPKGTPIRTSDDRILYAQ